MRPKRFVIASEFHTAKCTFAFIFTRTDYCNVKNYEAFDKEPKHLYNSSCLNKVSQISFCSFCTPIRRSDTWRKYFLWYFLSTLVFQVVPLWQKLNSGIWSRLEDPVKVWAIACFKENRTHCDAPTCLYTTDENMSVEYELTSPYIIRL